MVIDLHYFIGSTFLVRLFSTLSRSKGLPAFRLLYLHWVA